MLSQGNNFKVAIMQPYFLPYVGYFQLIAAVDRFFVYDNIKYTKKGWINRNRLLKNGRDALFSIPIKGASDYLNIVDRELAVNFDRNALLNQFIGAYKHAPFLDETVPLLSDIFQFKENNLFWYIKNSIDKVCSYLNLKTPITISSKLSIDHNLKGQDKVISICQAVGATNYINSIGGIELYQKDAFLKAGIRLNFLRSKEIVYPQFDNQFVPWLSIVDVLMFNPKDQVLKFIFESLELI